MVGRGLPVTVKKLQEAQDKEERLREAVKEYKDHIAAGKKTSYRVVGKKYDVDKSTLQRQVEGKGQTMLEFNATKQKLTPHEESVLVRFILESADRGFPLRHRDIIQYANVLRHSRLGSTCEGVGEAWVYRFLDRHHEHLQPHWSKSLDTQRARSLNPDAVKSWFDLVEKFIVDAGIAPENIYGMDESGFPTAYAGKERVIGARGTKTQHKQGGADRENVTAVVTICADGTQTRPLLIFKGKNIKESWVKGNSINAFVTCSDRGWTDGQIGCNWLKDVFEPDTREKAQGRTRVLLLDGHSSHYTIEFIELARKHNILLLGYPVLLDADVPFVWNFWWYKR
ncbi:hypothetical protein H1R20_g13763, partial [Candolleomyces eurysporus]